MKPLISKLLNKKMQSKANESSMFKKFFLFCMLFSLLSLTGVNAQADEGNASQKAMKIAESQTQGKAVGSKFIQKGDKKGYKVRILKGGEISHVFISLSQVQ